MSKGKKGKSAEPKGHTGPPKWEAGLLAATYQTDTWKMNIYMLVGNQYEDEAYIEACCAPTVVGQRRLFSVVSKADLHAKIVEMGNPKLKKPAKDMPPHSEIFETCKLAVDSGEGLPLPLLAKLIKWRLLEIRDLDTKRREAERKREAALAAAAAGGAGKKAPKSAGKKGKKTPEPSAAKTGSKLKKRNEEDLDKVYIDDEPDDGPQSYVFMHGFHGADLIGALAEIGIELSAIIKVSTQDYLFYPEYTPPDVELLTEADEAIIKTRVTKKKDIYQFWRDMRDMLTKQPMLPSLTHMAMLEYVVKNVIVPENMEEPTIMAEFGTVLFEDMAVTVYNLLDSRRQYTSYLENLQLFHVPTSSEVTKESARDGSPPPVDTATTQDNPSLPAVSFTPDTRYYNDLMNSLPQECVTVPLVLHCMLEQVVATENGTTPPSEVLPEPRSDGLDISLASHLNHMAFRLALTDEEHEMLTETFDMPVRPQDKLKSPQIINFSDEITSRSQHLNPVYGFNPLDTELEMLDHSNFTDLSHMPPSTDTAQRIRAARLQELLHFCASNDLTTSEVDHAFKQFAFECIEMAMTDPQGFVINLHQEGVHEHAIPWDDPYPYFKGMISTHDKIWLEHDMATDGETSQRTDANITDSLTERDSEDMSVDRKSSLKKSEPVVVSPKSSEKSVKIKVDDELETDKTLTEFDLKKPHSILRQSSRGSTVHRSHSANSVHFIAELEEPSNETVADDETMTYDPEKPHETHAEVLTGIIQSQKRRLDEWCFTEHFEPHVLTQVLDKAAFTLPYMDTYYHRRDHSLLVVFHNPTTSQLKIIEEWKTELLSDVGFRNYMELVAEKVGYWMKGEDAKYGADCLTLELEKLQELEDAAAKLEAKNAGKGRGASAKLAKKKSPKSSRGTSAERSTQDVDIYKRPQSLKFQKEEEDRIREEEAEKERIKSEKRNKSPDKKQDLTRRDSKKSAPSSRVSSAKHIGLVEPLESHVESQEAQPDRFWPFSGYNMGDNMINMAGQTTTLFPCDGGQIRLERTDILNGTTSVKSSVLKDDHVFIHILDTRRVHDFLLRSGTSGTTSVKSSVLKDDHVFVVHILDPRDVPDPPQDPEVIEYERRKLEEEKSLNDSDDKDLGIIDLTESLIESKDIPPKPSVSAFASVTANFSDGMTLAFSTLGENGTTEVPKKVEPPPLSICNSPMPPQNTAREGTVKGKKASSKEKEKPPTPEPVQAEEPVVEEEKIPEQPFQKVQVSCPDGLLVNYMLETSLGIMPTNDEDRRLVVKMSYPYKTSGVQECEAGKRKYVQNEISRIITSDGTVYKNMIDGGKEVMFADGTIIQTVADACAKCGKAH